MDANGVKNVMSVECRVSGRVPVLLSAFLFTAKLCIAEPVEVLYAWTAAGMDGWTNDSDAATLSNPGGYLNLRFPKQSSPYTASCIARRGIGGGVWVTNLSFRVLAEDNPPSALRLYIHALQPDRYWHRRLDPPAVGEWTEYNVPVDFDAGWTIGPIRSAATFMSDQDVMNWMGLYIRRSGVRSEENIRLDDFRVVGILDTSLDRDDDQMPDYWEAQYDLDPDTDDTALDEDTDGIGNLGEYAADTNPNDGDSLPAITRFLDLDPDLYLEWKGGTAATQYVEWTDSLTTNWLAIFTNPPPTTTTNLLLRFPGPVNFFRLRATRP